MPGFFEKRVHRDIVARVLALWPGADVSVVTSEYEPDAEAIRARVNDTMFVDLVQMSGRWVFIVGADSQSLTLPPQARPVQELPGLGFAAPAGQVAPAFVEAIRQAWDGIVGWQGDLMALADDASSTIDVEFSALAAELDQRDPPVSEAPWSEYLREEARRAARFRQNKETLAAGRAIDRIRELDAGIPIRLESMDCHQEQGVRHVGFLASERSNLLLFYRCENQWWFRRSAVAAGQGDATLKFGPEGLEPRELGEVVVTVFRNLSSSEGARTEGGED